MSIITIQKINNIKNKRKYLNLFIIYLKTNNNMYFQLMKFK